VAENKQGIILIIDNNTTNGTYLAAFCRELGEPNWTTKWLRVGDEGATQEPNMFPSDNPHDSVPNIRDAAKYIDEQLGEMRDVIVFYNAQLGLFQRSPSTASESEITRKLKAFVTEDRRILINIYAVNFPVYKVAAFIEPEFARGRDDARVIAYHSVNGAPPSKVKKIVEETLEEWDHRFMKLSEKSISR
jgi:hypothetical protein